MVRLAVCATESCWSQFGSRQRGVTSAWCPDPNASLELADRIDAAVFLESNRVDVSVIKQLLQLHKHVLLTNGSALSSDDWQALIETAQQAEVRFSVVNPERYRPSRKLIKEQLDAGKLGEPGLVRCHRWEAQSPEREPNENRLSDRLWNDLDLVTWFMGDPNRVFALRGGDGNGGTYIQIHLGYSRGRMGLIDFTNRLPAGDGYCSLSVIGSAGAVYADDHQNMQLVFRGGAPAAVRTPELPEPFVVMIQEFADAVQSGAGPESTASSALGVQTVTAAVTRSLESRAAIVLEDQ